MSEHLRACDVADYLDGMLDSAALRALEHHIGDCRECATLLHEHARLEECLYQAAEQHPAPRMRAQGVGGATLRASISTFGAAAAVLLMVFSFAPPPSPRAIEGVRPLLPKTEIVARGEDEAVLSCLPTSPSGGQMCADVSEDADGAPVDVTVADADVMCGVDEHGRQSLCVRA